MRLLSYNTYWKIMDPSPDKNACLLNSRNVCRDNVAEIILSIGLEKDEKYPKYDFISLQECTLKNFKKLDFPSNFINKYQKKYSKVSKNYVITLYLSKYHPIKTYRGNLSTPNDYRPFLIIVFKENLIHINVHFPHYNVKEGYKRLQDILYKIPQFYDPKYNLIFNGDFNHQPNFKFINAAFKPHKIFNSPRLHTCCREKGHDEYEERFDNIYTTIAKPIIYRTLKNVRKYNRGENVLMSDHLPVYSKI